QLAYGMNVVQRVGYRAGKKRHLCKRCRRREQNGVTVGVCIYYRIDTYHSSTAVPVLHDGITAQRLPEGMSKGARHGIYTTTSRIWDDQFHVTLGKRVLGNRRTCHA